MITFPLTIIADPLGGWIALGFIMIFVIKAILAAFGGDIDVDGDITGDIDLDSDGFGLSASDVFSLKGFVNFGVGFASTWALFGLDTPWHVILAILIGAGSFFALLWVYRACMKLDSTIVTENPNAIVGRKGTVYWKSANTIHIQTIINNRFDELEVFPDTGFDVDDFNVDDTVHISRVEGNSGAETFYISK